MFTPLTLVLLLVNLTAESVPILSDVRSFFQIIKQLEKEDLERIHASAQEVSVLEQELGSSSDFQDEIYANRLNDLLNSKQESGVRKVSQKLEKKSGSNNLYKLYF